MRTDRTRHEECGLKTLIAMSGACAVLAAGIAFAAVRAPQTDRDPFGWLDEPSEPGRAKPHVRADLLADRAALVPGERTYLGVRLRIDEGWHVYWAGRNDTGYPVSIDLELPEGVKAKPTLHPAPERYLSPGDILDHVYEDEVTLIIPIEVSRELEPGTMVTIRASLDWLVCREACVPESAEAELRLPVASRGVRAGAGDGSKAIKAAMARVPRPIDKAANPPRVENAGTGTYTITAPGEGPIAFYPATVGSPVEDPIRTAASDGPTLELRLADPSMPLAGVVEYTDPETGKPAWVEIVPAPESANPDADPDTDD